MERAGRLGAVVILAALASPYDRAAQAQYYPRPYPYYPPPGYYPPPPVYRPYPPPVYAAPPYDPPVYAPAPPQPSAALIEVQRLLAQLGYDPGPIDGLAGPRLADAVQAFQRDRDQSPTGRLNGETIGAIREAARSRNTQTVPMPGRPLSDSPLRDQPVPDRPMPDSPGFTSSPPRPTLNVRP